MTEQMLLIMAGLPGKMATQVAETIKKKDDYYFRLDDVALTGPNQPESCTILKKPLRLLPPKDHEEYLRKLAEDSGGSYEPIVVDFSQPDAVNQNIELYCKHHIPFVLGTTGGDRGEDDSKLIKMVNDSSNTAVIAPNMAKPIVMLQSMLEYAAKNFPGALEDFSMAVKESHQKSKKDTSGTAKAMVSYFNKLGIDFNVQDIVKSRDPKLQELFGGVPKKYIDGHGYHTYSLLSNDTTTDIEITHNIRGRQVYADGTIDAIKFLERKIEYGEKGCYNMIDVLKSKKSN